MHETIAVVFDFDDTLAPDTTSGSLVIKLVPFTVRNPWQRMQN